jgi:hypothetical protein
MHFIDGHYLSMNGHIPFHVQIAVGDIVIIGIAPEVHLPVKIEQTPLNHEFVFRNVGKQTVRHMAVANGVIEVHGQRLI